MSRGTAIMSRVVADTGLLTTAQAPAVSLGQQYLVTAQTRNLLFANMVADQQRGFLAARACLDRVLRRPAGPPAAGATGDDAQSLVSQPLTAAGPVEVEAETQTETGQGAGGKEVTRLSVGLYEREPWGIPPVVT